MILLSRHSAGIGVFCLLLVLQACVKDTPVPATHAPVNLSTVHKVLIGNEGNFGSGNASVSLYDPASGTVVDDIYKTQNGTAMGDVLQSMAVYNKRYFFVMNNSSRILVTDAAYKQLGVISGLPSPRYFLPVSNQKAYVSDFKANAIHVVDLNTFQKTGSIPMSGWSEQLLMFYNKVYVCNLRRNYAYIINALNDTKSDSIHTGPNANGLVRDRYDKIWILCAGDSSLGAKAKLIRYNPYQSEIEASFPLPESYGASHLCLNAGGDTLYFLQKHLYRVPVTTTAVPAHPFVSAGSRNFYAMAVSGSDGLVYVADALDYVQKSVIYVYSPSGELKSTFKAGINSGSFYFE